MGQIVEIGVVIPHTGPLAEPRFVVNFCRRAEEVGFDTLWAADHLAVPQQIASTYTLGRRPLLVSSDVVRSHLGINLEMMTTLAVAVAVTTRVRIGSCVAVLPLRNPILVARQLATLDLYSGGRLVCGVGVGWLKEEAEALSMPWDHRGARSEEQIHILRALWGAQGETVSYDGVFYSFPPIASDPRPKGTIPILIGGHSDVAIDRATRIGDGWIAARMDVERLAVALARLRDGCERAQREWRQFWLICGAAVSIDDKNGYSAVTERLLRYEQLGVHQVFFRVQGHSADAVLDALDRWGEHVLSSLSRNVAGDDPLAGPRAPRITTDELGRNDR